MFSKSVFIGLMVASQFALAGNGIERIKLGEGIDYAIVPALHQALVQKCTPAAVNAYQIIATKIGEEEKVIDQGQADITYDLSIKLVIDPKHPESGMTNVDQGTPDVIIPVSARVTKFSFSNPTVPNVEVESISGPACF